VDGDLRFNYQTPLTIRGDLILRQGARIDASIGNPVLTVQGNITVASAPCTWAAGKGGCRLTGIADQAIDLGLLDGTFEPVLIDKPAGRVILQSDLSCASLDHQAGTLEPNGKSITTPGNSRIHPGAKLAATLDGSAWSVGGALDWQGQEGDLLSLRGTSLWRLNALGAVIVRYTDVAFCDARDGNPINALDGTSIDGGNNLNWLFPPVQPFAVAAGCVQLPGAQAGIPAVPTAVAGEAFVAAAEKGVVHA
jgi:hypothetical protein